MFVGSSLCFNQELSDNDIERTLAFFNKQR